MRASGKPTPEPELSRLVGYCAAVIWPAQVPNVRPLIQIQENNRGRRREDMTSVPTLHSVCMGCRVLLAVAW